MSETDHNGYAQVRQFVETWSPLDLVVIYQNLDRFLYGAVITLELTILALIAGGLISIPLAIVRSQRVPILNSLVWLYTYVFRGTPLLVQTYLFYFGLSQFELVRDSFLWRPVLSNAWWCAFLAFTLNTAAYTTELLSGAISATPKGELDAAKASGFSKWSSLRHIVLPGALRRAIPAYSNEVVFMLHGSAVASTITLQDILGAGRWLNGRYYLAYEGLITAALFYMILVVIIARVFRIAEKKWLVHLHRPENNANTSDENALPIRI